MTATCAATRVKGTLVCGEPAEEHVTAGCVHEHISSAPVCGEHREWMARGDLACAPCLEGSDPHECVLVAGAR